MGVVVKKHALKQTARVIALQYTGNLLEFDLSDFHFLQWHPWTLKVSSILFQAIN